MLVNTRVFPGGFSASKRLLVPTSDCLIRKDNMYFNNSLILHQETMSVFAAELFMVFIAWMKQSWFLTQLCDTCVIHISCNTVKPFSGVRRLFHPRALVTVPVLSNPTRLGLCRVAALHLTVPSSLLFPGNQAPRVNADDGGQMPTSPRRHVPPPPTQSDCDQGAKTGRPTS